MKDGAPDIMEDLRWLNPPSGGWNWEVCGGILAVVLLLAVAIWYGIVRKKIHLAIFAPPPPHLAALKALHELRASLSEENQGNFVVDVSQVVRVYIQARFGLRAPHRSTEEFLREAGTGDLLLKNHQQLLRDFLGQCDLVKFARLHVATGQMSRLLDSAFCFVEETIPVPESKAATGGEK